MSLCTLECFSKSETELCRMHLVCLKTTCLVLDFFSASLSGVYAQLRPHCKPAREMCLLTTKCSARSKDSKANKANINTDRHVKTWNWLAPSSTASFSVFILFQGWYLLQLVCFSPELSTTWLASRQQLEGLTGVLELSLSYSLVPLISSQVYSYTYFFLHPVAFCVAVTQSLPFTFPSFVLPSISACLSLLL